ncbi:MAG: PIN domain-containing protein [Chromatiales bacterium]|jgi:tRNA(fMet)-specific endonuclease VapC|nr:PIN domain-containing protein [Chromatiales bacterium]
MRIMLDTNTCIAACNHTPGFRAQQPLRECVISVVVLGELEWGVSRSARKDENRATLNRLLNAVAVVGLGADTAREYGNIRAHLYSIGKPIGPNDLWIAAHARSMSLPLVTNNTREFARVPRLAIENWIE